MLKAIDLPGATLTVRESLNPVNGVKGGHEFAPPKTAASVRQITLPTLLVAAFEAHRARQAEEKRLARKHTETPIWCSPGRMGRMLTPRVIIDCYERVREQSGLKVIRFHDLRHSHVGTLIQAGVPLLAITERLGHSSVKMTQDLYGHLFPGIQEAAATALDQVFRRAQTATESTPTCTENGLLIRNVCKRFAREPRRVVKVRGLRTESGEGVHLLPKRG
jgi:integrase